MGIYDSLHKIFTDKPSGVFLFVGSGFSRRYLGLEDWKGLLEKFCVAGNPFEYYLSKADGDYPTIARLLATEFNDFWWKDDKFKESVAANKGNIKDSTSALRIEISKYLSTLDQSKAKSSEFVAEVELLSRLNVDGIITTNWDMFLEELFPDYKTYIGQEELLFANPQHIGEIYKIHGCSSNPSSLVLTDKDYQDFNDRNPYLAAKLITLFVEHPIIFIGYSISDSNIRSLLHSVSKCIGNDQIEKLRQNLIFVQRPKKGESDGITDTYLTIEGIQIPIVLVKTNNLVPVFEAIDSVKRKIPTRLLRFFKEQLYQLVHSSDPEQKMSVVDIDAIEKSEDIEFVVGLGVSADRVNDLAASDDKNISQVGYSPITAVELFRDVINDNRAFDSKQILENVIPHAGKNTKFIPVYKYLHAVGITDQTKYKSSELKLDKWVNLSWGEFQNHSMERSFRTKYSAFEIVDLIRECTPPNAAGYIPFLLAEQVDQKILLEFLKEHEDKLDPSVSNYASSFKKLTAFYDKVKWGWD